MKILIQIAVILSLAVNCFGQGANWLWAVQTTGAGSPTSASIAADASGNIYVTGAYYESSIIFGTDTLINHGDNDIFLVKYSPGGQVLWTFGTGGIGYDLGNAVSIGPSGDIYITGYYLSPSLDFDAITINNGGNSDMFIARFDSNGNVINAISSGSTGIELGYGIATDLFSGVFVTGTFNMNPVIFGSDTLYNSGDADMFIVKYDANLNAIWAKKGGGSLFDCGISVATDIQGNSFITGSYESPAFVLDSITLTNTGSRDIYIAKYDSSGALLWATNGIGSGYEYSSAIVTDLSGNAYVTGQFQSTSFTLDTVVLTKNGYSDMFLAKYNPSGELLWAKNEGGNDYECGFSMSPYSSGLYLILMTASPSIVLGFDTIYNAGYNLILVNYDTSGNAICAAAMNNGGNTFNAVAADNFGNAYASSTFNTDTLVLGNYTLLQTGQSTLFLAMFNCDEIATQSTEFTNNDLIAVYPNPLEDILHIQNSSDHFLQFTLYNSVGQKLIDKKLTGNISMIDLSSYLNGIYLFQLNYEMKVIKSGIVIKQ